MTKNKRFTLKTPRLQLKELTTDDAKSLFSYRSLPEVTRFQGWSPASEQEAVRFVEEEICHVMNRPDTWFQLGIFLGEEEILIGDVGIHFLAGQGDGRSTDANDGEMDVVEIGVTLSPEFQGRGFASEAVWHVLDYLFGSLHKNKVIASVDPENHKSIALLKRAGFQLVGIYQNSVLCRGAWVDDAVFTMTRKQWQNQAKPTL